MIRIALASTWVLASAIAAHADEFAAARATTDWTGFYVGASVGGARGDSDLSANLGPLSGFLPVDNAAARNAGSPSLHPKGVIAGVQGGYNHQLGALVFGVEVDFGYFDLSDSTSNRRAFPSTLPGGVIGPPTTAFSSRSKVDTDYLLTLRPRLGYAYGNALFFATGGLALSKIKLQQDFRFLAPFTSSQRTTDTKAGWALGAGVEYALATGWSVKAEYLHVDFGSIKGRATETPLFAGFSLATRTDLKVDLGRIGVNYRF
jgi:outer membrane immunogenic protein